jgi:hypothetical protein
MTLGIDSKLALNDGQLIPQLRLGVWQTRAGPMCETAARTLALTALATSRTEVINFGSATLRFRVPRMHARELHTD